MRILVIEDEKRIADFLSRGLSEEGHRVEVATDLATARDRTRGEAWDLFVVDRMLPDGDGLSLVRELRRGDDATPAICLTARDRVEERVEGLLGGADDYLVKPFSFDELLARIASVTRRGRPQAQAVTVGDLTIDLGAHRVTRAGREIRLTPQEFNLLRFLAENAGHVMTRTRILDAVWDMRFDPGTNMVDVYISYLRAKVDKGFDIPLIHTVRGVGYVLEARSR
ncbi:MAG: winged helix-turn-helix domain-containing protein [Myxococcota bacterium]